MTKAITQINESVKRLQAGHMVQQLRGAIRSSARSPNQGMMCSRNNIAYSSRLCGSSRRSAIQGRVAAQHDLALFGRLPLPPQDPTLPST